MARRGDVYANRVTGERCVVLRGEEEPGEPVLVHLAVQPGGAVAGEHVHPALTERFRVLSGTLGTSLDGVRGTLAAGEEAAVAPGVRHDWWNAGDDVAHVVVEVSPPEPRFEQLIATAFGLANAGRVNAKGMPSPLQMALLGAHFRDVIVFTSPPPAVQRAVFALLGPVARARGLRPTYPEMLVPHGHEEPDPAVLAAAGLAP